MDMVFLVLVTLWLLSLESRLHFAKNPAELLKQDAPTEEPIVEATTSTKLVEPEMLLMLESRHGKIRHEITTHTWADRPELLKYADRIYKYHRTKDGVYFYREKD
jgi:hypothetical protein